MVYDMPDDEKRRLCDAKVDSQFTRAMKYVEAIDAAAVVPTAGPPAFLDDDLWHLNVIDGDELSIFPDQRSFLRLLDERGRRGELAIPGTEFEIGSDGITVRHPIPDERGRGDLRRQGAVPPRATRPTGGRGSTT